MPDKPTAEGDDGEADLLAAARAGDQEAFRQLWSRVERPVFGVCLHLTGNRSDALDAVQETQLAVWRHLDRFQRRAPFPAWVLAIARNAARDVVRHRSAAGHTGLDGIEERGDGRPPFADAVAELVDLRAALAVLPDQHREALLLWAGGMTYEHVAAVQQVPLNTVKTWIYRARQQLRARLAG
ncbi:sigma-70 family RNA polymerase sigma factor [Phytohabitans flavus]|uniref:RNA polymerase sigma factor n=1 Tax=Phytohabitans flavus TaxID=1076124 RepID=A0A6F8XT14_9ACTN|nr:RNA polymerase sigma factor [Phytohabitans flavus]BCB76937.1 RNA polymerase sigma factor [Phytohabitans flavus]